jgi:hypothetical protein
MKKICTVLVPLKDNHHRTVNLLKYSIFDDFEYIFADGSLGVENEKLFEDVTASNIRYIRFAPDDSIDNFYKKMSESSQLVETDYVVNPYYSVNGLSSFGLRLGAGLDYKLYRNIHIVGKFHTNLGLMNSAHAIETAVDPLGLAKLSYKKVNITDLQTSYLSLGVRFLF